MSKQKYPQAASVSSTGEVRQRLNVRKNYSSAHLKAKRNRKRQEAEYRQEAWDKLTVAQKMASLIEGGSKKQRNKLEKLMDKSTNKPVESLSVVAPTVAPEKKVKGKKK